MVVPIVFLPFFTFEACYLHILCKWFVIVLSQMALLLELELVLVLILSMIFALEFNYVFKVLTCQLQVLIIFALNFIHFDVDFF